MSEEAIEFVAADGVRLAGTFTRPNASPGRAPASRRPAALLLSGSGPLDRNSNTSDMALGVAQAVAAALAEHGFGSLRFDKRGVGASSGDYLATGFDCEYDDASAALASLRAHPAVDPERVFVVGHSVGAVQAVRLVRATPPPAGYVLLAGAAQQGERVMEWQSRQIAVTFRGPLRLLGPLFERRQARERERVRRSGVDRHPTMPRSRVTDRWLREYMDYDPAPELRAIDRPLLAITGAKDIQVDPADVAEICRLVAGRFEAEVPADLTHLLRRDAGPPGLRSYGAQLTQPVDPWVADRIATWARVHFDQYQ